MSKPSTQKVKNFRRKIKEITDHELELRAQLKRLYDQFILDVQDEKLAIRHVRQAYYEVMKFRMRKRAEDLLEFHPFFGLSRSQGEMFGDEDDDEDNIL